jgi:hypothetical protein
MSAVTFEIGHIADDAGTIVNVQSPRPPFQIGVAIQCKTYKVGVDFTSGYDLVFNIAGTDEVFAVFTTDVGAIKAYAETTYTAGHGKTLTLTGCTTDIKAFVVNKT